MAFKLEAFQNKFLPPGQPRVDAILTVTADAQVQAGAGGPLVFGFIVDKSGSMAGERIEAVRRRPRPSRAPRRTPRSSA